jgi:hypothetical protein
MKTTLFSILLVAVLISVTGQQTTPNPLEPPGPNDLTRTPPNSLQDKNIRENFPSKTNIVVNTNLVGNTDRLSTNQPPGANRVQPDLNRSSVTSRSTNVPSYRVRGSTNSWMNTRTNAFTNQPGRPAPR